MILTDNLGRNIHIVDNALSQSDHENLYRYVSASRFKIGYEDTDAIERANNKYIHSAFTIDEYVESGFKNSLEKTELWSLVKDKNVARCTINLSTPSDTNYLHTHKNQLVLLYYLNLDWKPEWAGETLFYEDQLREIIFASMYTPRRLILFDGDIPHSIRPQAFSAPHYRFTFSVFLDK
jgi:SM-20-related protein